MTERVSRLNRDVRSETSVSDRDVSSKRHAQTVTFQPEPSLLSVPAPPRTDTRPTTSTTRALCAHCGATPGGCQSLHLLGGRRCCTSCVGDHEGGVSA